MFQKKIKRNKNEQLQLQLQLYFNLNLIFYKMQHIYKMYSIIVGIIVQWCDFLYQQTFTLFSNNTNLSTRQNKCKCTQPLSLDYDEDEMAILFASIV